MVQDAQLLLTKRVGFVDGSDVALSTMKWSLPIYQGCVDPNLPYENDMVVSVGVKVSKFTGMIQLDGVLPLDVIYSSSHNPGTVGDTWKQHHDAFAEYISTVTSRTIYTKEYVDKSEADHHLYKIMEIGGGSGRLATNFFQKNPSVNWWSQRIRWTIYDPATPKLPENFRLNVVNEFYDPGKDYGKVDVIVHSHLLEHLYDPMKHFQEAYRTLKENGELIFSIPNFAAQWDNNSLSLLNFEHTYYCSDEFVRYAAALAGFTFIDKKDFKDHSTFYNFRKTSHQFGHPKIPDYSMEFSKGVSAYGKLVSQLTYMDWVANQVKMHRAAGNRIVLFGAGVASQRIYLTLEALGCADIEYLADNDYTKHGRRLYGTPLVCHSPAWVATEASKIGKPAIVICSHLGPYQYEIMKQMRNELRGLNHAYV